jgi:hypothetical protein
VSSDDSCRGRLTSYPFSFCFVALKSLSFTEVMTFSLLPSVRSLFRPLFLSLNQRAGPTARGIYFFNPN